MDIRQKFGKVAVLFGGDSAEREVSLRSGSAVSQALKNKGIDVIEIDASGDALVAALMKQKIDRCIIMFHGEDGENGHVQSLLDMLNIPYTGSGMLGCALAMDKILAKDIWQSKGMLTPKYKLLDTDLNIDGLSFPLAIKPVEQGSSVGITRVDSKAQLADAYDLASKYGLVMAEEWIQGKELTVSIVQDQVLPSIWIEPSNEFYDYDAKYISGSNYHCPSGVSAETEQKLKTIALKAYSALKCTGWGRVDFILSTTGALFLIEVNTVPGMTNLSLVPQAAKQIGWDFETLVLKILETSL
ncbi:D-alanine--D-alanine ligase [Facilibium subflavum]|uniref:D-alanine--D-alanine ligase n=1 Tax=Facilibium subflavum TaxID=2219058 RepID=UPI001AAD3D1C|nr:D-alanine--D-alanine ligase [Facilibium subflavum]